MKKSQKNSKSQRSTESIQDKLLSPIKPTSRNEEDDEQIQNKSSRLSATPVQAVRKAKDIKNTLCRLFKQQEFQLRYSWKNKAILFFANVGLLFSSVCMVILPFLCGLMIDNIRQSQTLLPTTIYFLILTIIMAIFSALRGYAYMLLGEKVIQDMRNQLFTSLVRKDIAYYDENNSGKLVSRLSSDITTVYSASADNVSILVRNVLQFGGSLVFLWVLSWKLALMVTGATPIISLVVMIVIKKMKHLQKQYSNDVASANSLASQVFSNIRVVRSFSNQSHESENYKTLLQTVYLTGRKKHFNYGLMLLVMTIFGNLVILSILYFGGSLVIQGQMTIGDLTSFVLYTITLIAGFASVSGTINQMVSALGVCEHLFQVMDHPIKIVNGVIKPYRKKKQSDVYFNNDEQLSSQNKSLQNKIQKQQLSLINASFSQQNNKAKNLQDDFQQTDQSIENLVEFEDACFSYPSKSQALVLNKLNLKIKNGESVAIVGPSGSGKSSIVNLILRFYDLTSGNLKINSKSIKQIDMNYLRRNIGFVSQEPTLFSGSIKYNVEYGLMQNEKSLEKTLKAMQVANAKQFVMNSDAFPDELQTKVGEKGVKLSGGQKQRIAIARCVIKDPFLLIFDEATSALDAESQFLVQKAIDTLVESRNKTMIIVAHRLSTIINCDRIVVLKDGQIAQQGTHQNLLRLKGIYASLVQKQISHSK